MPMSPEERRELCITSLNAYMEEAGMFSENTRILLKTLFENVLFPPITEPAYPPPGFPGAASLSHQPFIVPPMPAFFGANAWSKETPDPNISPRDRQTVTYLNVSKLFETAIDFKVIDQRGKWTVIVTDQNNEEWTLKAETATDFLGLCAQRGMFLLDTPEEMHPAIAFAVEQMKARAEEYMRKIQEQMGRHAAASG